MHQRTHRTCNTRTARSCACAGQKIPWLPYCLLVPCPLPCPVPCPLTTAPAPAYVCLACMHQVANILPQHLPKKGMSHLEHAAIFW